MAAAVGEIAAPLAAAVLSGRELHGIINNIFPGEYNREYDENGVPRNSAERWLDKAPVLGPAVRWLTGDKLPQRRRPRLRARSTCRRFSRALLAHHQQLRTRGDGSGPPHTRTQPLAVLLVLPLAATKFLVVSSAVCPRRCPVPLTSTPPVAG